MAEKVHLQYAPGHFFSPVVDPKTVVEYVDRNRALRPDQIRGIDFHLDTMLEFWNANVERFRKSPREGKRFTKKDVGYPLNDARTLRVMIQAHRPKRIIEIGSGWSSSAILDATDEAGGSTEITCIEPYPERLLEAIADDRSRITLIDDVVQNVPLSRFASLAENDILFIDSTHVLKTGSDVHYELLEIIPSLQPGVLIHFHDCKYPFEYPNRFIFEKNYSWNEAYALRAFLMFNSAFKVFFYNSLFAKEFETVVRRDCPEMMKNPGSSIWIRRVS